MTLTLSHHPVLFPILAQVFLTFLVWSWMSRTRIRAIYASRRPIQDLADSKKEAAILDRVVNPSDNFINLFEVPVLFFVAALIVLYSDNQDPFYLICSWGFVAFRYLHSLIHCTTNTITHRFLAYLVSTVFVWVFWLRLGFWAFGY